MTTTSTPSVTTTGITPPAEQAGPVRLTRFAAGGGCACKIPPGELERIVAGLTHRSWPDLLVGLDDGDDCAAVRLAGEQAVLSTADFFTPVVDDPATFGAIAAANALSDIYASGGTPVLAINLLGWPRSLLDPALAAEVLAGALGVADRAGCPVAGGHSIDSPEPLYGMAVTGIADPGRLLRNDAARAGDPISLTKPLGVGVLNNRHKATGEWFEHAVDSMTALNAEASAAAVAAGVRAATDVTGFGLLGHLHKMARASHVTAVIDAAAVPYLAGARASLAEGFVPGGSRRNLDWVRPHLVVESGLAGDPAAADDELLLLADAQTSGGLLVAGELPGHPRIGTFEPARPDGVTVVIR